VPQATRRLGRGEGVSPSPLGDESGEGAVPPLQKNFRIFMSEKHIMAHFWLRIVAGEMQEELLHVFFDHDVVIFIFFGAVVVGEKPFN